MPSRLPSRSISETGAERKCSARLLGRLEETWSIGGPSAFAHGFSLATATWMLSPARWPDDGDHKALNSSEILLRLSAFPEPGRRACPLDTTGQRPAGTMTGLLGA
jgi:hypothetical protein